MKKEPFSRIVLLAATSCLTICCQNDLLPELSDYSVESTFQKQAWSKSIETVFEEGYIDIPEKDYSKMSDKEKEDYVKAITRIGVYHDAFGYFRFHATCGSEINISESLYWAIRTPFEYTNSLISSANSRVNSPRKMLTSNPEGNTGNGSNTDCVPVSISHMGRQAPSIEDAKRACSQEDPGWRIRGYVHANKISAIIGHFVATRTYGGWVGGQYHDFELCVMTIDDTHAVNAQYYLPYDGGYISGYISYYDYQNNQQGHADNLNGITLFAFE